MQGDPVTGPNTPTHCGENAGKHLYLYAGAYTADSATLSKVLTGSTARTWKIKVTKHIFLNLILMFSNIGWTQSAQGKVS